MTDRQHRYGCERVAGKGQREAAVAAGYSPQSAERTAGKLEHHPAVRALIDAQRRAAEIVAGISRETVLAELQDIGDRALADLKPDFKAAVRSRELIGKELQMFADRSTITLQHVETMSARFADTVGQAIDEFCDPETGQRLRAALADRLAATGGADSGGQAAAPDDSVRDAD